MTKYENLLQYEISNGRSWLLANANIQINMYSVFVAMYIYKCVCICVYIYIRVSVYMYIHLHVHTQCVCERDVYVCMAGMHACTAVRAHAYLHVRAPACAYVCVSW